MTLMNWITRQPARVSFGQRRGGGTTALDIATGSTSVALTPLPGGAPADLPAASLAGAGVMTAADKTKLDALQPGIVLDPEVVATRLAVTVATVDAGVTHLRTAGYGAAGDGGGGLYRRVASQPGHAARVQSADGAWWELVPDPAAGIVVEQLGAAGDNATDDTAAINSACAAARALDINRVLLPGRYVVAGTLSVPGGVTLQGNARSGPYFKNFTMSNGSVLRRPAGAGTSSMAELDQTGSIDGLVFDYEETGGCPTGIISFNLAQNITYCTVTNVHVFGERVETDSIAAGCVGINLGQGTGTSVRYFNRFANIHVSDCDIAFHLGDQCNANVFTNIQTRECHVHWSLDGDNGSGGGECIENVFSGLGLFSISGALVPSPVGFRFANRARGNVFSGIATEMFGQAFSHPQDATCTNNTFAGLRTNEANLSYLEPRPGGIAAEPLNYDDRYARPVNVHQHRAMLLPVRTTTDMLRSVAGARFDYFLRIEGTLPTQDAPSGALSAGASFNKTILRLGPAFQKSAMPNAFVTLRLMANRSNGAESVLSEHRFRVRKTSNTGAAMALDVIESSLSQTGTVLRGLYVLTGVAAADNFGIAAVIGGGSAAELNYLTADLEITHNTFDSDERFETDIRVLASATATDVTTDDVTDAIDLLTPGSTAF